MKIEILEEFVIFAKYLSFTKAAEELYMTQPALSMHMTSLEHELGFKLIDRGHRSALTPAGQAFLSRCQELIELYHFAVTEGRLADSAAPPARILDRDKTVELHLLASKVRDVPYVLVDVSQDISLWEAVEKDIVDMGLGLDYHAVPSLKAKVESLGFDSFPVSMKHLGICIMNDHPLAKKKALRKSDLYDYPIGIGERAYYDEWQAIIDALVRPEKPLRFRLDPVDGDQNYVSFNLGDRIHFYMLDVLRAVAQYRKDIIVYEQLDGEYLTTLSVMLYNTQSSNPNVQYLAKELKKVTEDPGYRALSHSNTD